MLEEWNHKIFGINQGEFEEIALEIFNFQYHNNKVYKEYTDALQVHPASVQSIGQIPFLPIRFFKSHAITTGFFEPAIVFESSGTTGSINSKHFVKDISLYEDSFLKAFAAFYGNVRDYCIIGLLPSYLERSSSSLVYMVDKLITLSQHSESGFYLYDYDKLHTVLAELEKANKKTLLIGVTYALLDFAEQFPMPLKNTIIMETGGMKGRREEMIRPEVHRRLKNGFGDMPIHSEYGMTELLSQAYSKGHDVFNCPPWMKVLVRDEEDPLLVKSQGSGVINIIDLANIYSCSFIATDDAGKLNADCSFEVMGRIDGSDLRGCSLMVAI
ncbi:acyl transferase [Chitinophagaceae bacterium IBVUCB2]|nr:acyl transferase [Chitinophagaceae bacterium IBVUCB2]